MTSRFTRLSRLISYSLPLVGSIVLSACNGAVPHVSGHKHDLVIPDRSPSRQVQALDSPSTEDASSGSGDGTDANATCQGGHAGTETSNPDGSFDNVWLCDSGGIVQVENRGTSDANGNGSYDQITLFADGALSVWHFTFTTDATTGAQSYVGMSDDGTQSSTSTYTPIAGDASHYQLHEVFNTSAGVYTDDGVYGNDGSFVGTETFDDPNTDANPDWSVDANNNADGTFSQAVVFNGDGFTSNYTYATALDGSSTYSFQTDMLDTQVSPDYDGSYNYNADFSGIGSYTQHFDDGSTDLVSDVINADGSVVESWSFDDASTDQSVDQEGQMTWHVDGSAEGTVTTHVVGGGEQTCDVHVSSSGAQTVDNCQ